MADKFKAGDVVICTEMSKDNYENIGVVLEGLDPNTECYSLDFNFYNNVKRGTITNYSEERIELYDFNK